MLRASRLPLGCIITRCIRPLSCPLMRSLKIGRNDSLPVLSSALALPIRPFSYVSDICSVLSGIHTIFEQLLHNCLQILRTQHSGLVASFRNVLLKTCWAVTQLVDPSVVDGWKTPSAVRTSELLCNVFVLLGNSGEDVDSKCYS
jgi:hypothetical protein